MAQPRTAENRGGGQETAGTPAAEQQGTEAGEAQPRTAENRGGNLTDNMGDGWEWMYLCKKNRKDMKKIYFVLALVAALAVGVLCGYGVGKGRHEKVVEDTIRMTIYDTICCVKPVAVDSVVLRYEQVFVPIEERHTYTDTMHFNIVDSVSVAIPISQKHYADSLYDAWVSGYNPMLDSIKVFQKTEYINTIVKAKQKRWGLGIQGGVGITPKMVQPYVGIGVSYNFISF